MIIDQVVNPNTLPDYPAIAMTLIETLLTKRSLHSRQNFVAAPFRLARFVIFL